ncbi:uncharacterized protein [Polyergus mexicanus]|uniref:uncharacterized protein n=1 Tax=Polyergus mexicanus TaxID=615972 RepID=UPI0038B65BD9
MTHILNIRSEPIFDDRIVKIETHTYNPYANTTFEHSDEIRIPTQQQNLHMLPYESFLYIEGKLNINKPAESRNVEITSTLKNCVTISSDRTGIMRNAGWDAHTNTNGYFNFCVPLYMLLGFCEDYRRVVINARHELILIRSRNDNNYLIGYLVLEPVIDIFKIQWRMPHVVSNEINKLSMLRALESGQYLSMGFRSWDLQAVMSEDTSRFDDCKLTNMKLYLNSECYPYDDMNLDFDKNRWSILYDTYQRFCKNYYGYEYLEPSLTVTQFNLLTKSDKSCASWLIANHHGLRWEDGNMPYDIAKHLIKSAVLGTEEDNDTSTLVYVKGCQKREWLVDLLEN